MTMWGDVIPGALFSTHHDLTYYVCLLACSHHKNVGYKTAGTVSVLFTALTLVLHSMHSKHPF